MLDKVFNNETFDILEDEKYYYFFRALNKEDCNDLEKGTITKNNKIITIRTDRQRCQNKTKYKEDSKISLEEVFDHIKMHHRKDTNCISLSINANVSLLYGREYYKDKYVIVKAPKDSNKIINAGLYILEEVEKEIKDYKSKDELINYLLTSIENANSKTKLLEIKKIANKELKYDYSNETLVHYDDLNNKQNLVKDKIISKLAVIDKEIIKKTPNIELIQAINNAFSSLEYIHYQTIEKDEIINVTKEQVDMIALLQQLKKQNYVDEIKQQIIKPNKLKEYKYDNYYLDDNHLIEKLYEITKGKYNYVDIASVYKKSYYLSKSILRREFLIKLIKEITNNKYENIYEELKNTYGIEKYIFSKQDNHKLKINEKLELNFSNKEKELFEYINSLGTNELKKIIEKPEQSLNKTINHLSYIKACPMSQEKFYEKAFIDIYNSLNNSNIKQVNIDAVSEYNKLKNKLNDTEIVDKIISPFNKKKLVKTANKLYTKK